MRERRAEQISSERRRRAAQREDGDAAVPLLERAGQIQWPEVLSPSGGGRAVSGDLDGGASRRPGLQLFTMAGQQVFEPGGELDSGRHEARPPPASALLGEEVTAWL